MIRRPRRCEAKLGLAIPGLALLLGLAASALAQEPLGKRPGSLAGRLSSAPNESAMVRRIRAPAVDEGYVAQGLTTLDGRILVGSYQSADPQVDKGPCRILRIDPGSGAVEASFTMPAPCAHAGGLANVGGGMIVVADTRRIWRIDAKAAFASGQAAGAVTGELRLGGALKGSFAAADGSRLWLGRYDKKDAALHALPAAIFDQRKHGATITGADAVVTLAISTESQGAAFDHRGTLWLSQSGPRYGQLQKLDAAGARCGRPIR